MSQTLAEISAPWFRRTRMRIFPLVLKVLWAAAVLAGATTFAHSQAPAPAKSSHAPGALPLTKFYDTPNPLPAGKPGKLIRSEPFDEYVLPYQRRRCSRIGRSAGSGWNTAGGRLARHRLGP